MVLLSRRWVRPASATAGNARRPEAKKSLLTCTITHVDGQPMTGISLQDLVDRMRGPPGQPITLTIKCKGHEEPFKFKFTLVREIIQVRPVKFEAIGDVAYLRIT